MRAAVYARISADPEGLALGVERQVEDCLALADRLGHEVIAVYRENDVSASTNSRKARPLYDEMLARARRGDVQVILAYSNSRLTRRPREVEDLIDLHARTGTKFHTVVSGDDDLSTADGRMTARIKASVDAAEAERTSERARRAKRQMAAAGKHRGGPRPYGWEPDGMTVRPDEAAAIVAGAEAVLAGRSLAAIAREWNGAGRTTSTGVPWTYSTVRSVLARPRNAGLVSHGRSDRREVDIVGPAQWGAILSEDVWRATWTVLMDPARRVQQGNEKRWLGSGLYLCGICGGPLRVAPYRRSSSSRAWLYRCTARPHLTVSQEQADAYVMKFVGVFLAVTDGAEYFDGTRSGGTDSRGLRDQRQALVIRLETFERDYAEGLVSARQLADATAHVHRQIAEIDEELAARVGIHPLSSLAAADDPAGVFHSAPLDSKRSILSALGVVTIRPVGRGRKVDIRDRVEFTWRRADGPGQRAMPEVSDGAQAAIEVR